MDTFNNNKKSKSDSRMGITSDGPPGDSVLLSAAHAGGAKIPLKHYTDLNMGNFPIK